MSIGGITPVQKRQQLRINSTANLRGLTQQQLEQWHQNALAIYGNYYHKIDENFYLRGHPNKKSPWAKSKLTDNKEHAYEGMH